MTPEILNLKKLNCAYIAALEYDYCPEPEKATEFSELFETGLTVDQVEESLREQEGRRPDEIAGEMSDIIKQLS